MKFLRLLAPAKVPSMLLSKPCCGRDSSCVRHLGAGATGVPMLRGCSQHTSLTALPAAPPQPGEEASPWTASRGAGLSLPRQSWAVWASSPAGPGGVRPYLPEEPLQLPAGPHVGQEEAGGLRSLGGGAVGRKFTGTETGRLRMSQPSALPLTPPGAAPLVGILTVGTPRGSAPSEAPGTLFGAPFLSLGLVLG